MTDKIKDDEIFNRPELKTTKNDIPKICKHLTTLSTDPLNKRIEELEKANYELGEQVAERGATANRLHEENDILKTKVESIKKEARDWKTLYENAKRDREVLTNVIDNIYDDLSSTDICKDLKETYAYVESLSELNYIKIHNDDTADGKPIYIRAAAEFKYIINQIITIMESLELNQSVAFASADEVHKARGVAYDIIAICEANDEFYITLKKFSELYEVVNAVYNTKDDPIMHAFNSVLLIFSKVNSNLENVVSENVVWKNKAMKVEKALNDQKKLNDAKDKELSDWKMRTEEAIRDYTKCNEALGEWKRKYRAMQDERDKALERAEKFKGIVNSVYGMTIPGRCNGKQAFCDIATGKKILIDKKKYDELVEWIDAINTTYDTMFFMNKPAYLPIMIEHLNDLTK
jgi:DNA repair exonuclease SbcCD ATPase subunit